MQTIVVKSLLILFNILIITDLCAENDSIFLCIDSMLALRQTTGTEPQKLVYGYIEGKKTSCMSEHALRSLFSESSFKQNDFELKSKQEKVLQQNAVFRGEKNLQNADLRGMDLQGIDLSNADLSGAHLESADLRNAKLINTKLKNACLDNAYCKNTDLRGADFTNTTCHGTFFQNANLQNTEGVTVEILRNTATLYNSKFDDALLEVIEESLSSKRNPPKGTWVPASPDEKIAADSIKKKK